MRKAARQPVRSIEMSEGAQNTQAAAPRHRQGTAKQNRTEQTKAQKQEKHTRTDKALSAEQAADFGALVSAA